MSFKAAHTIDTPVAARMMDIGLDTVNNSPNREVKPCGRDIRMELRRHFSIVHSDQIVDDEHDYEGEDNRTRTMG